MLTLALVLLAAEVPLVAAPVNDMAAVVDDESERALTVDIEALRQKTGVQLAILVVESLPEGATIEGFSLEVAERWKGGDAARDDGLLLTLAIADRKSRLEVGYGLEGHLTDGEAGAILQRMREKLRASDYAGALRDAVDEISRELADITPTASRGALRARVLGRDIYRVVRLPLVALVVGGLALTFLLAMRRKKGPRPSWVPKLVHHRALSLVAWLFTSFVCVAVDGLAFAGSMEPANTVCTVALASLFGLVAATGGDAAFVRRGAIAGFIITAVGIVAMVVWPNGMTAGMSVIVGGAAGLPIVLGVLGHIEGGGGGSSSSGSSWSSSSSSDSSSSSSSDYGGGGGSFGGGGASSDW